VALELVVETMEQTLNQLLTKMPDGENKGNRSWRHKPC
jgi:hypothetical protein